MSHRVRTHHWINGVLDTKDTMFDDFVSAFSFARRAGAHHIKIYDETDTLVHDSKPEVTDSYA